TLLSRNPAVVFTFQAKSIETPGSLIKAFRDDERKTKSKKENKHHPLLRHSGNAVEPESRCCFFLVQWRALL
uniref:hypothetical protein n=1 Tax=Shewanella sp. TaxID=50422 RepID=UPI0040473FD7